jgi:hypothetical protein
LQELKWLFLETPYILNSKEYQPIWSVLEDRRSQPIDEARCVCFLIAEHIL